LRSIVSRLAATRPAVANPPAAGAGRDWVAIVPPAVQEADNGCGRPAQCRRRAPLFDPANERAAVRRLAGDLLEP